MASPVSKPRQAAPTTPRTQCQKRSMRVVFSFCMINRLEFERGGMDCSFLILLSLTMYSQLAICPDIFYAEGRKPSCSSNVRRTGRLGFRPFATSMRRLYPHSCFSKDELCLLFRSMSSTRWNWLNLHAPRFKPNRAFQSGCDRREFLFVQTNTALILIL